MKNRNQSKNNISSAEMTAIWRSEYAISKDHLSKNITTVEGKELADQFVENYSYPLVSRKVSVRARFFLDNALSLLHTNKYDSCISFASGFSLLLYFIRLETNIKFPPLKFIDTDLLDIIQDRSHRLKVFDNTEIQLILKQIHLQALDLESSYQEGRHLKEIFPECSNPIFIIEGVIYFLSAPCIKWLFQEISSFENAGVIFDYWPEEGLMLSKCFTKVAQDIKGFMRENVLSFFERGFWSEESFMQLTNHYNIIKNTSLMSYENSLAAGNNEEALLLDQDEFFPVKLCSAKTKNKDGS